MSVSLFNQDALLFIIIGIYSISVFVKVLKVLALVLDYFPLIYACH